MIDGFKKLSFFEGMSVQEIETYFLGVERIGVERGQRIFSEKESAVYCYFLSMGSLKMLNQIDLGNESILKFCAQGEFVAGPIILNSIPVYPVSCEALEYSILLKIPAELFKEKWAKLPRVANDVSQTLVGRMNSVREEKCNNQSKLDQRIAHFFLSSIETSMNGSNQSNYIPYQITRKDISQKLGVRPESVTRVLSSWTKNEWIKTESKRIYILNKSALESL